ncbi:hypothetical protein SAMD00019534_032420 [Acytostelium subglobosum LB1]|uniref:hypothetical protein n=1 Tax=Acytostelium subglobosum LB1 TaxID=1410327 RepID=UPI000644EF7F|nr:hypothetical protein SAMD00019534_032420 [Acytostelium subglobosum LB1]GAM20067.1 hypothetical protein SAMD00019534_032420 [Acytostelium subglobosum LB1]|eukprot:XP_012756829.1 hypothetical protein SAMD00019534_032420 [Acytostelium subglobosum LB1]
MKALSRLLFLIGVGLVSYHTNPTKEDFDRQLSQRVSDRSGKIAGFVAKNAMSMFNILDVRVRNCIYFSMATRRYDNSNAEDLVGIGVLGKWFFLLDD